MHGLLESSFVTVHFSDSNSQLSLPTLVALSPCAWVLRLAVKSSHYDHPSLSLGSLSNATVYHTGCPSPTHYELALKLPEGCSVGSHQDQQLLG